MHQLLLRGLPPLYSVDNDADSSSSSSCVLLDGDWPLASPREAVAAALMKRHLSSMSAAASASTSSSSVALLRSRPLSHAVALALADKVWVLKVLTRSLRALLREIASASVVSFFLSLARFARSSSFNLSSFLTFFSLFLKLLPFHPNSAGSSTTGGPCPPTNRWERLWSGGIALSKKTTPAAAAPPPPPPPSSPSAAASAPPEAVATAAPRAQSPAPRTWRCTPRPSPTP